MASIINGLFSGRSGISSHGVAIAVVGDNISNANTLGYKRSRSEFEDIISGGQTSGKTVGSGSSISKVTNIFEQGTIEYTGRTLDLAVDGNGFFAVDDNGTRTYTRAGNFTIDASGFVVNQKSQRVLGFPSSGTGALEELNVNKISQFSVATQNVAIAGNLDASGTVLTNGAADIPTVSAANVAPYSTTTYADLNTVADFTNVVSVFDSLGTSHTVTLFFFHTDQNEYTARAYVNSEEVDPESAATDAGLPRQVGQIVMAFDGDGSRNNPPAAGGQDFTIAPNWNNGATPGNTIDFALSPFTQYSAASDISSINGDGDGIGSISKLSIDRKGQIYALLDNGQSSIVGTIGLVNFANPEGLVRIGGNALLQSTESGAPIVGKPGSGTFGSIESGSIELSTVDIASEFVKLITLQRGFQANSRIITTINQLLNEIIQLA